MPAFKLIAPIEKRTRLEKTDAQYGTETYITVRQGAQGEHEARANVYNEVIRETQPGSEVDRTIFRYSYPTIVRHEVWLTLSACDITGVNDKPLFRFHNGKCTMSLKEFTEAWSQLPRIIADEIHSKVLDVNPDWRMDFGGDPVGEEL